ncbi:hypothetical protein ACTACK_07095 [Pseudomonas syringae]|uniref:hypothetical protein n=1 Tax=Pseudomonas syringae TaxID=317 RepID=UPI003F74DE16
MNQQTRTLSELEITEFRERYPNLFSDPAVEEIYCDPGWKEILIALSTTTLFSTHFLNVVAKSDGLTRHNRGARMAVPVI